MLSLYICSYLGDSSKHKLSLINILDIQDNRAYSGSSDIFNCFSIDNLHKLLSYFLVILIFNLEPSFIYKYLNFAVFQEIRIVNIYINHSLIKHQNLLFFSVSHSNQANKCIRNTIYKSDTQCKIDRNIN